MSEQDSRIEAEHAPAESEAADTAEARDGHGAERRDATHGQEPAAEESGRDERRRAEEAERALKETRQQLEQTERRQRIDELLMEAETVDLESARMLTEAAVQQMDEADVQAAVEDLRQRKPHLFRQAGGSGRGAMGAKAPGGSSERLDDVAETAAMSGDRRDLLRYLRMRRRRRGKQKR
jgi:hypothetical protein